MRKSLQLFITIFASLAFVESNGQTTHVLDYTASHTGNRTDTTITVAVNDSVVILNHNTLDDDFEYSINGGPNQGAYNTAMNAPIYGKKLVNTTITSIKVVCYDPTVYRLVHIQYSSTGITDGGKKNSVIRLFPNPATNEFIHVKYNTDYPTGMITLHDLNGKLIKSQDAPGMLNTVSLNVSDLASGVFFISFNSGDFISKPERLIISK